MSVAALQALIAPLVAPGLLILADQNGPRPDKRYATLSVRSTAPITVVKRPVDANGVIEVVQPQQMVVEVQWFGQGSFQSAQEAGVKLRFPSVVDRAEVLGVSIIDIRSVTRVPELLNQSQYEERAILEFLAYDTIALGDDVGLIEHVELDCFSHTHVIDTPNPD